MHVGGGSPFQTQSWARSLHEMRELCYKSLQHAYVVHSSVAQQHTLRCGPMRSGRSVPVQAKDGITSLRPRPRFVQNSHASAFDVDVATLCTERCSGQASCAGHAVGAGVSVSAPEACTAWRRRHPDQRLGIAIRACNCTSEGTP
jgi:hypothetical protein